MWYKDIDQMQVNREVTAQTGLTEDKISLNYEMPKNSLINSLKNKEPDSQNRMKMYKERTRVARELESQRCNEYVIKDVKFLRKNIQKKIIHLSIILK